MSTPLAATATAWSVSMSPGTTGDAGVSVRPLDEDGRRPRRDRARANALDASRVAGATSHEGLCDHASAMTVREPQRTDASVAEGQADACAIDHRTRSAMNVAKGAMSMSMLARSSAAR